MANILTFLGNATSSIDEKSRTSFPKELRQYLPEESEGRVVVTVWENKTLQLFPIGEWNAFTDQLAATPRGSSSQKLLARLSAFARESKLDAQNRISLTDKQMEYAGLNDKVTFVANGRRVTLWQPERFNQELNTEDLDQLFNDDVV